MDSTSTAAPPAAPAAAQPRKQPAQQQGKQQKPEQQQGKAQQSGKAGGKTEKATAAAAAPAFELRRTPGLSHLPGALEDRPAAVVAEKLAAMHPALQAVVMRSDTSSSSQALSGALAETDALLGAIVEFVREYKRPALKAYSWDLDATLIKHLSAYAALRPMLPPLANAVRAVRSCISHLAPALSDEQAREAVLEFISTYRQQRLAVQDELAAKVPTAVVGSCSGRSDGFTALQLTSSAVVLTYGHSATVTHLLITAHKALLAASSSSSNSTSFRVVVLDARPEHGAFDTARTLCAAGITVQVAPLCGLQSALAASTVVLLGATAVLGDGSVLAASGSSLIAAAAAEACKPVYFTAESCVFSDRTPVGESWVGSALAAGSTAGAAAALGAVLNAAGPVADVLFPLATTKPAVLNRAAALAAASAASAAAAASKQQQAGKGKQQQQQQQGGKGGKGGKGAAAAADAPVVPEPWISMGVQAGAGLAVAGAQDLQFSALEALPHASAAGYCSSSSTTDADSSGVRQAVALLQGLTLQGSLAATAAATTATTAAPVALSHNLRVLNLLYDRTPASSVSGLITEVGQLPPSLVPLVLAEFSKLYDAPDADAEDEEEEEAEGLQGEEEEEAAAAEEAAEEAAEGDAAAAEE